MANKKNSLIYSSVKNMIFTFKLNIFTELEYRKNALEMKDIMLTLFKISNFPGEDSNLNGIFKKSIYILIPSLFSFNAASSGLFMHIWKIS